MKTQQVVLDTFKIDCLDGRDAGRLGMYFKPEEWEKLGLKPADGFDVSTYTPRPWTEEAIKAQLALDVAFGFEKALNKRGISASLMHSVVKMWMWVLDDPLHEFNDYAQYGLPFFKAVALKYNLPNPIGDDEGNELEYAADE